MILDVATGISSFMQLGMLDQMLSGVTVPDAELLANDSRESIIGIAYLVMYVVSAVFFLRWFRRVYSNLAPLGAHMSYTPGWAVGSWFVPFFKPYSSLSNCSRGMERERAKSRGYDGSPLSSALVGRMDDQ